MGADGTLEFRAATSIATGSNLTFSGTQDRQVRIDNDVIVTNNGSVTIGRELRGDNANATWINAANASLTVGGTLLATGQLVANATGNTVAYNGATNTDIKTPVSGQYYNLTVSGAGTMSAQADLEALNNVTISSGVLNANSFDLTVGGHWSNTGSFTEGNRSGNFQRQHGSNYYQCFHRNFPYLNCQQKRWHTGIGKQRRCDQCPQPDPWHC